MAPCFDYGVLSLFCAEDTSSIFDEVDNDTNYNNTNNNNNSYNYYTDIFEINSSFNWKNENPRNIYNKDWNFIDLDASKYCGCNVVSDECLASMFDKERQDFMGIDYLKRFKNGDLDLDARNLAIDWILKVQSHYNFGPLCAYLSVNYLDRFLSAYELPKSKAWMMQLLAVACLSLAAKIDESHETNVPLSFLQVGDTKFIFEAKTIQRMELLVLSTLKWKMQSVTPFSFIDYFLNKESGDGRSMKSLISQATQLILSTIKDIELLEFRPSEIAGAVAFSVTQDIQLLEVPQKALSFITNHVPKDRLMKCVEKMQKLRKNNSGISTSVPQIPIGVLDGGCLSYKSDETSTLKSCANFTHCSPTPKRRKLED